jgi:ATP-dependent Lhr-like helicase
VRETIGDTLHEALDIDRLRALLEGIESGDVTVHCVDTTEASVLSHEIINARPYAFLDDEEFQNRRTNAVTLRRGLTVDLAAIGSLDPDAIDQVHTEIQPELASADDLHDLLSSLVVGRPRDEWRELFEDLASRGRAVPVEHEDVELWCTTEGRDEAARALAGDDTATTNAVRGHLEISGITTAEQLAEIITVPTGRVASALGALEHEGFAMQGRYTADASGTEWVARRLLARMHSYSRRSRRERVEPVTAQDFMRFLLRWQHVAPDAQLAGEAGLVSVIEQLQGAESAAVTWEPELFARRLRHYEPGWLDRLCHDGDVAWLRLTPRARDGADAPAGAPSKATPIAVVFRADLPWLLDAARLGVEPAEPSVGATAEIVQALRDSGACFATDLVAATRRLPDDVERGLWDGVARGLIMCDGFGAIRARVSGTRVAGDGRRMSRLRRGARAGSVSAGRWSLVPGTGDDVDRDELAEAVAEQLINRWGVVFRDLAVHDSLRMPWRDIQWALRRLEDRGLVLGGRFVSGFSGEQYALPTAADQLTRMRKEPRTGERVVVNATDPLNLVGLIVPGETVPAVRTKRVTYVDGVPETEPAPVAETA